MVADELLPARALLEVARARSPETQAEGPHPPRGDAAALAARMHAILTEAELRLRMGRQGRDRAVASFSLEAAGRPFLQWYERTLGDGPGSREALRRNTP